MGTLYFNALVPDFPDTIPPVISVVFSSPSSTSVSFTWQTDEAGGTAYWIIDQNPTRNLSQMLASSNFFAVTASGTQSQITQSGLTPGTQYYIHILHRDASNNDSNIFNSGFQTTASSEGTLVTTSAELIAAINAGTETLILVAPGTYTAEGYVAGKNRTANPLTIQAQNPANKPVFTKGQSVNATHHVTLKNLIFDKVGSIGDAGYWIYDSGTVGASAISAPGLNTTFLTIDGCEFYSPDPGNRFDTTPNPTYSSGMAKTFRLSNFQTHSYVIKNCYVENAYSFGDFRVNGALKVTDNRMVGWYFDGIRFMGQGDESRTAGDKLIARNDFEDCVGVYNEVTTTSPHPDNFQGMNNTGTNPKVEDLIFYRNRSKPGIYRAGSLQYGLTQTPMHNVGYIENMCITKGNIHGISLEAGGDGVLIERCTMGDSAFGSNAAVTVYKMFGQLIVTDSIFPGGFRTSTANGNSNLTGYELTDNNNTKTGLHTALYVGPSNPTTLAGLMTTFTPKPGNENRGAINTSGAYRGIPHRPMRAIAPSITPGAAQATITIIYTPTLMADDQVALGGTTYTRYDIRHCAAGTYSWSTVTDVNAGDVLSVTAGSRWFQTRCVNSAGEGLWSKTAVVTIT
jgi:hypothetical protein